MKWSVVVFCFVLFASSASAQQPMFLGTSDVVVVDENDNVHRAHSKLFEKNFVVQCWSNVLYWPNNKCPEMSYDGLSYRLFTTGENATLFQRHFIKETLIKMGKQKNRTQQSTRDTRNKLIDADIQNIAVTCTNRSKVFSLCAMTFRAQKQMFRIEIPKCTVVGVQKLRPGVVQSKIAQCVSTKQKPRPTR